MDKDNLYILDFLRGFSAFLVIFHHFFIFFFTHQTFSASLLHIEPLDLTPPFYLQTIRDLPIDIGQFGVSLFFLISGFLIQPSLQKYFSLSTFLKHKFLRLWPTYTLCFSTSLFFVTIFCILRNIPFPYSLPHILSYFFWMRDIVHYPFIDGAVWTLEIQVKFYLFAGMIWSLGKKDFLEKICVLTFFMSILTYGIYTYFEGKDLSWFYLIDIAHKNLKFFAFMLLGACIYSVYKNQISWQKVVCLGIGLLICFLSSFCISTNLIKMNSYLLGFFSFSFLILFYNKKIGDKGPVFKSIKWISDISYPLYAGHVLPGYTIMYFTIYCGLSVYLGIFISLFYVFLIANFISRLRRLRA